MAERYVLSGKVALVTGGARGIGLATAKVLASRGASVVIVDLDQAAAERAASEVSNTALGLAADVTDRGAMQRVVATTVERFGHLDVVIANAGIASRGATFRAMANEAFTRVLDVNLNGVWITVETALPEIIKNRGHVVVISSVYAFVNGLGATPYAMAKAAVEAFGRGLRVELQQHGASATVAYFGFIDTDMVRIGIDGDPLSDEMMENLPRVLRKRLQPVKAGEGIVHGIENRKARIIRPRRWAVFQVLRGVINPISDAGMLKDDSVQDIARKLDAREGEEQPTTA
jgi:NAD(P)-dependent dehydrogenase (short-subunit alcohol dehydrogenase family)